MEKQVVPRINALAAQVRNSVKRKAEEINDVVNARKKAEEEKENIKQKAEEVKKWEQLEKVITTYSQYDFITHVAPTKFDKIKTALYKDEAILLKSINRIQLTCFGQDKFEHAIISAIDNRYPQEFIEWLLTLCDIDKGYLNCLFLLATSTDKAWFAKYLYEKYKDNIDKVFMDRVLSNAFNSDSSVKLWYTSLQKN